MLRANRTEGSVSGVRLVTGLTNATFSPRRCSARNRPSETEVRPTLAWVAATKYERMGKTPLVIANPPVRWRKKWCTAS
jgi:hypothetical protein